MPAATSPRKRALMPSGPLRRALRAHGHPLTPVVQIGKLGVTDALRAQIDGALGHHELIKVKVGAEAPLDRFEAADQLAANAGPQVAQILGRAILLYRRHPEHPKFEK